MYYFGNFLKNLFVSSLFLVCFYLFTYTIVCIPLNFLELDFNHGWKLKFLKLNVTLLFVWFELITNTNNNLKLDLKCFTQTPYCLTAYLGLLDNLTVSQ